MRAAILMELFIGILSAYLIGFSTAQDSVICDGQDSSLFHPHEDDCHKFYICLSGIPVEVSCPENHKYSSAAETCVSSTSSQCNEEPPDGIECPAFTENTIHSQHPEHCEKFLKCSNGVVTVHDCPEGLHWDIYSEQCNWPELAKCEKLEAQPTNNPNECDPYEDSADPTHLPHLSDCSKFYKCQGGTKFEFDCPHGLHWNNAQQLCDYPENTECQISNNIVKKRSASYSICSSDGYEMISFPGICTKYIQCSRGLVYVMSCPLGLFWNDAEQRCDYAHKSECMRGQSSLYPGEHNNGVQKIPDCPEIGGDSFLAHPNDCAKYIQCWSGSAHLMDCPAGLHWSSELNRCDWPIVAKCNTVTTTTTTSEPPTDSTENPTTISPSESTEDPTTNEYTSSSTDSPTDPTVTDTPTEGPAAELPTVSSEDPAIDTSTETLTTELPLDPSEQPSTEEPVTNVPVQPSKEPEINLPTDEPQTESPANSTEAPVTDPLTEEPATDAPVEGNRSTTDISSELSEAPATDQPATEVPGEPTEGPQTSDSTEEVKTETTVDELTPTETSTESFSPSQELTTEAIGTDGSDDGSIDSSTISNATDVPPRNPSRKSNDEKNQGQKENDEEQKKKDEKTQEARSVSKENLIESSQPISSENLVPVILHQSLLPTTISNATPTSPVDRMIKPQILLPSLSQITTVQEKQTSAATSSQLHAPQLNLQFFQRRVCPLPADMKPIVSFGNPNNCSEYYECQSDVPQLRICPEGQHWSELRQKCAWSSMTECLTSYGYGKLNSSTNLVSYTQDRDDCTKFVQHFGNLKITITCPGGLFWNQKLLACDLPVNVQCRSNRMIEYNMCPNPKDQPYVPDFITFANSQDCQKFMQCKDGFAYHLKCPTELLWNNNLGRCDWPEYVACNA